jgi:hypothetical protein
MLTNLNGIKLNTFRYGTVTSRSLNASPATLKLAFSFIAKASEISTFWVYCQAVAGTAGNRKITFELQSDSSGAPSGTVLKSYEQTGGFAATTHTEISPSWTGSELVIGTRYWIVLANTSTAPTVDYITIGHKVPQCMEAITYGGYNTISDWGFREFNGTNWTAVVASAQSTLTIVYVSGLVDGLVSGAVTNYDANYITSTTRRIGCEFQVPAGAAINIIAASLYPVSQASPAANRINVYVNRVAMARSIYDLPLEAYRPGILPRVVTAHPGDWVAVMTNAIGDISNYYYLRGQTITDNAIFLANKPFGGTARRVKLESESTWTVDPLVVPECGIWLDPIIPFLPKPINRRTSTGR